MSRSDAHAVGDPAVLDRRQVVVGAAWCPEVLLGEDAAGGRIDAESNILE